MPAKMHPDPLPAWVTDNPLRSAEVKVYATLKQQLSSRYSVYYSSPWIQHNPDGTERDGEADFVVASVETGYVVVEVKGGAVGRDKQTGEWYSIDRNGWRHRIKNPMQQATSSKYVLANRLKETGVDGATHAGAGIVVILPDSTGKEMLDGLDTPREKFALHQEMATLGNWMVQQLNATVGDYRTPLGAKGMAVLDHLLAHAFELRIPLASTLEADERRTLTATDDQAALIESLEAHARVSIAGAAGSGKTILALHKATQLAEASGPMRVLLTCFNKPLGMHLKRTCHKIPAIVAGSYHQTCNMLANAAGVAVEAMGNESDIFDRILPGALITAVAHRPELAFDAIIVDEGQDFSDVWLESLQLTLRSDKSLLWIFYDDTQQVHRRCSEFLATLPTAPFRLRRNVRNPRTVFERLAPLLGNHHVTCIGPAGQPVEEIVVKEDRLVPRAVAQRLERLIESDQVEPNDIAVLVSTASRMKEICPEGRFGQVRCCSAEDVPSGRICVDTVRRFKGLERRVIVVVDPADVAIADDLNYVALSRPTGHLILVGSRMSDKDDGNRV